MQREKHMLKKKNEIHLDTQAPFKNGDANLRFCESFHIDSHRNVTLTEIFENPRTFIDGLQLAGAMRTHKRDVFCSIFVIRQIKCKRTKANDFPSVFVKNVVM